MRPEALARQIEEDLAAGLEPCFVTAAVGTTSLDRDRPGPGHRRDLPPSPDLAPRRTPR